MEATLGMGFTLTSTPVKVRVYLWKRSTRTDARLVRRLPQGSVHTP
jgi:hypothetical protein